MSWLNTHTGRAKAATTPLCQIGRKAGGVGVWGDLTGGGKIMILERESLEMGNRREE